MGNLIRDSIQRKHILKDAKFGAGARHFVYRARALIFQATQGYAHECAVIYHENQCGTAAVIHR
jgi:hypothetical protein